MDVLTVEVMFNVGFFALEDNPLFGMKVLYCSCVLHVYYERETERGTVRESKGYYSRSTVGCVSPSCWII